jgi:hypothetical protein
LNVNQYAETETYEIKQRKSKISGIPTWKNSTELEVPQEACLEVSQEVLVDSQEVLEDSPEVPMELNAVSMKSIEEAI